MLDLSPILAESKDDAAAFLVFGVVALVALLVYFLPFAVAALRGHQHATPIFLLNLLLGWSFVGWVIALVWAFTDTGRHRPVYVYVDRESGEVHEQVMPGPPARSGGCLTYVAVFLVTGVVIWGGLLAFVYWQAHGGFGDLLSDSPQEPHWQDYTDRRGRYTVTFPDEPSTHLPEAVRLDQGRTSWVVSYSDEPGEDEYDFDRGIQQLMASEKGKLLDTNAVWLGDVPGREFTFEARSPKKETGVGRLYYSSHRLYQLLVRGPNVEPDSADVQRFFDSFQIEDSGRGKIQEPARHR